MSTSGRASLTDALQKSVYGGRRVYERSLVQHQRPGETDGEFSGALDPGGCLLCLADWLPTDALAYSVLSIRVKEGEALDDSGRMEEAREGGYWVLTSPNDPILLHPTVGVRQLQRKRDGHWGLDDPSRWPQFYSSEFQHHPFIPRFSKALSRLFWEPTRDDCLIIPGHGSSGILILHPDIVKELRVLCDSYRQQVWDALETRHDDLPALWVTDMYETLDRLSMGLYFRNIVKDVADLQRTCLDIHGWLNLVNTFLPRTMRRSAQAEDKYEVDKSVMGAFTLDISVAQRLYRIGVPVYLLRPSTAIPANMNIKTTSPTVPRLTSMSDESPAVVLDDYSTPQGPYPFEIYRSSPPGTGVQRALQRICVSGSGPMYLTPVGEREEGKPAEMTSSRGREDGKPAERIVGEHNGQSSRRLFPGTSISCAT